ncbi:aspartyl-phosphate phosphatase Spo0E family protein [Bacillus sp. C1]
MRKLHYLIEKRKEELIELVKHYGFCHPKVLKLSQDLDKLIIRMMEQSELSDIITKASNNTCKK